jgi:hypothetical protein
MYIDNVMVFCLLQSSSFPFEFSIKKLLSSSKILMKIPKARVIVTINCTTHIINYISL